MAAPWIGATPLEQLDRWWNRTATVGGGDVYLMWTDDGVTMVAVELVGWTDDGLTITPVEVVGWTDDGSTITALE